MPSSPKGAPSQIDINRAETMLRMGLSDYAAMQKEANALAKELVHQQKGGIKSSGTDASKLTALVGSLRTAEKDIQDQLQVLRNAAQLDGEKVAHGFAQTQHNVSDLEVVLRKLQLDNKEERTLLDRVETVEGANVTSLLETQRQLMQLLLTLIVTLVVIGATALAVFKPEYMWIAKNIALLCLAVAAYYLIRYLVQKFL